VHSVKGVYEFGRAMEIGMTIGDNPTAGMDTIEFEKYLNATILPLYPDESGIPGKSVAIIVDSGHGRVNTQILVELCIQGYYLIPGVPNTTHATHATDHNYGPFKTKYRDNLSKLTEYCVKMKKTIQQSDIPFLMYGGEDDSGVTLQILLNVHLVMIVM